MPGQVYIPQDHSIIASESKVAVINYVAAIFAAIGSFLFGYDSGIIGSVISTAYDQFHKDFKDPNDNVLGAVVSVFAGGAFFGAIVAGGTANRIGRKRTIQFGCCIAIVGCSIQTGAVNTAMLIVGRFIAGLSIGVLSMIVPLYQAEISPPHARGLLSGWTQQMIGFGFFIASWVGFGCQKLTNSGQWRIPLAIQIVPAILLLFGMFLLPYSPRWLASVGRHEEAKASLQRLHGGRNAKQHVIDAEYEEIVAQIEWEKENLSSNVSDLVNTRPNLHRTLCGCMVQAMCQWTGVNVNAYFGPTIYSALGYTGNTPLMINAIQSAWSLIVTWIFITFLIDRIGRRPPLVFGGLFMAAFLLMQSLIAKHFVDPAYSNTGMGIAGIASIFLYSASFSMSYGPVSWVYQSEVFPMNLRALGTSASTATNWLNNVIISQFTPVGLRNLNWKFFLLFMATNLSNSVIAYFLFPETKNKTLEEIGALFGDENVVAYKAHQAAGVAARAGADEEKKVGGVEHTHSETVNY